MDNPFTLIAIIWRSVRPSRVHDMPSVRNSFWLRKGYAALTFFGTIVTATDEEVKEMSGGWSSLKNHEMIHLRQAQATGDSWLHFYLLYVWYWLRALPLNRRHKNAAYWLNPFEMEAYRHMYDQHYLDQCQDGATEWKEWAKMKPRERLRIYLGEKLSAW